MTALEAARSYVAAGLSVIPVLLDGTKKPAWRYLPEEMDETSGKYHHTWKPFQKRRATDDELVSWFSDGSCGIAVICGEVSGGLEVLDFDDPAIYEAWADIIRQTAPGFLETLPTVATPRGGYHVYCRTGVKVGNQKLARSNQGKIMVETRAEGGYVLAPPCPGYHLVSGPDITKTPAVGKEPS